MRRSWLAALAALVALPGLVLAETRTLGRFGSWEVFGGTSDDGQPLCGVSTNLTDGRYFGLKYWNGRDRFIIQLVNPNWRLDEGLRVPVSLQFDNQSPWNANAVAHAGGNAGAFVEFNVPFGRLDQFLREFRLAEKALLTFPGGQDRPWGIGLTGSNAASQAMDSCIKALAATAPAPRPAPVQPPSSGGGSKF